jgi:hypothetical protein
MVNGVTDPGRGRWWLVRARLRSGTTVRRLRGGLNDGVRLRGGLNNGTGSREVDDSAGPGEILEA